MKKVKPEDVLLPTKLENPNGLFSASKDGVLECRVVKSEGNVSYLIKWHVVTHKEASLDSDQIAQGGKWYTMLTGQTVHIRKSSRPEPRQQEIYKTLAIGLYPGPK